MSSKSGAADILEALGVKIDLEPATAERVLARSRHRLSVRPDPSSRHAPCRGGAPRHRQAHHLQSAGPAGQPGPGQAPIGRRVRGRMADALCRGAESAGQQSAPWWCMARDGLDELTTTDVTHVAILEDGVITRSEIAPEDAGLKRAPPAELQGGTADGKCRGAQGAVCRRRRRLPRHRAAQCGAAP